MWTLHPLLSSFPQKKSRGETPRRSLSGRCRAPQREAGTGKGWDEKAAVEGHDLAAPLQARSAPPPPGSVARTPHRYSRGARELQLHTPARQMWWKHSRAAQPRPQTMGTWTKGFLRLRSLLSGTEETQMELRQSLQSR